jgi:hypothetical protein
VTFHGELAWRGHRVECPAGTPPSVVCRQHEGSGVIPGLGAVTERYLFLNQTGTAECPGNFRVLPLTVQFIVGTKGTIQIASAPSTDCMPEGQAVTLNFPSFTITGGSGIYSGASGTPRGVKRARVRYRLSALDETDGALPVTCRPPTGSLFKVGRTVVTCSATDRSGNTGRARFTVTVRARR